MYAVWCGDKNFRICSSLFMSFLFISICSVVLVVLFSLGFCPNGAIERLGCDWVG